VSAAEVRTVRESGHRLVETAAGPPPRLTRRDARAVDAARAGAAKRLEREECRKILSDFTDAQGRTLPQNLDEWGMSPADYISLIPFVDGSSQALCRQGRTKTALVASPGVRRVFVCPSLADVQLRQPGIAESMVLHESLHTLGLGGAPQPGAPTSIEITQRVEARCRQGLPARPSAMPQRASFRAEPRCGCLG
jgi:hypothetical protein